MRYRQIQAPSFVAAAADGEEEAGRVSSTTRGPAGRGSAGGEQGLGRGHGHRRWTAHHGAVPGDAAARAQGAGSLGGRDEERGRERERGEEREEGTPYPSRRFLAHPSLHRPSILCRCTPRLASELHDGDGATPTHPFRFSLAPSPPACSRWLRSEACPFQVSAPVRRILSS